MPPIQSTEYKGIRKNVSRFYLHRFKVGKYPLFLTQLTGKRKYAINVVIKINGSHICYEYIIIMNENKTVEVIVLDKDIGTWLNN